jgi:hypothetical protein
MSSGLRKTEVLRTVSSTRYLVVRPEAPMARLVADVALLAILIATVSCAHSFRVSRGGLERLRRSAEHFVLVFGSLSIPGGKLDRPTIRFLHPGSSGTPDAPLWSATITKGERFYAVLHAPASAEYLDAFYVEVGSEMSGFDRILYRHMRADQQTMAVYVGEIEVRPASDRSGQGQKVLAEMRDDFQNAQRELRRLYPRFDGPVISTIPERRSGQPL